MNPDFMFLSGLFILSMAFPAVLAAFSSSNQSFRPVLICVVLGGGLLTLAMVQSPKGYSLADVPRIAMELVR